MTLVYEKSSFVLIMTQLAVSQNGIGGGGGVGSSGGEHNLTLSSSTSSNTLIQNKNGINYIILNQQLDKEEEKMTLSQLLCCFPEIPSNIPIQPLNANQHKLRRDTVVSAPTITSKASSMVHDPSKPLNISLSSSNIPIILSTMGKENSSSNLLALSKSTSSTTISSNTVPISNSLENISETASNSMVGDGESNIGSNSRPQSPIKISISPPSSPTPQQQQNIPDNLSESSSCSVGSSGSNHHNHFMPIPSSASPSPPPQRHNNNAATATVNGICLSKSQSLDNMSLSSSPSSVILEKEVTISSNTPIPLPPPPQPVQLQQQQPQPQPHIMPTSSSSSPTSSPIITSQNNSSTTTIKLPPSTTQTISTNNMSRKTQMPQSNNHVLNNNNNSPINSPNNKNLNINNSPSSSTSNQNSFSPTKRLTIAFGSLTRGSNSSSSTVSESSIVPIKWEKNLNQIAPTTAPTSTAAAPNSNELYEQYFKLCKGEYQQNTSLYNKTFNQLLDINMNTSLSTLDKCYDSILKGTSGSSSSKDQYLSSSSKYNTSGGSGSNSSGEKQDRVKSLFSAMKNVVTDDIVNVRPSKTMLYFGTFGKTIGINTTVTDEIILNSFSSKKVKFKVSMGPPSKTHSIQVSESEGFINKKSSLTLNFSLTLKSSIKLRRVVIIEIEGGVKYFCLVQIESNKTAFGQPIEDSELVEDNTSFGPMLVPRALVVLKQAYYSCAAHTTESIFRLPPTSDTEFNVAKDKINREAITTTDPHCIATLIKVFFRDLPNLLLNDISPDIFLNFKPTSNNSNNNNGGSPASIAESPDTSKSDSNGGNDGNQPMDPVFIVNLIPDPKRSTFLWLIDLLAETSKYELENKQTAKNLSIIFSPNLYFSPNICSVEDSFAISGKVVSFILELIQFCKSL